MGTQAAMQPIPLPPNDQLWIQNHRWEAYVLGKMRKAGVAKDGPTQWASPVFFVVRQDAKGRLGRMANTCGNVERNGLQKHMAHFRGHVRSITISLAVPACPQEGWTILDAQPSDGRLP